jgi:regulator of nucleoside diphosphate kinase
LEALNKYDAAIQLFDWQLFFCAPCAQWGVWIMKTTMNFERYLTQRDAALLSKLAENLLRELDVKFNKGEQLVDILSTAILLPETVHKDDCVTLHSEVVYRRLDTNEQHSVTIVCPYESSPALARISALAPLALALIGRQIGSVVQVELHDDQFYEVKVVSVKNIRHSSPEFAVQHA